MLMYVNALYKAPELTILLNIMNALFEFEAFF